MPLRKNNFVLDFTSKLSSNQKFRFLKICFETWKESRNWDIVPLRKDSPVTKLMSKGIMFCNIFYRPLTRKDNDQLWFFWCLERRNKKECFKVVFHKESTYLVTMVSLLMSNLIRNYFSLLAHFKNFWFHW